MKLLPCLHHWNWNNRLRKHIVREKANYENIFLRTFFGKFRNRRRTDQKKLKGRKPEQSQKLFKISEKCSFKNWSQHNLRNIDNRYVEISSDTHMLCRTDEQIRIVFEIKKTASTKVNWILQKFINQFFFTFRETEWSKLQSQTFSVSKEFYTVVTLKPNAKFAENHWQSI